MMDCSDVGMPPRYAGGSCDATARPLMLGAGIHHFHSARLNACIYSGRLTMHGNKQLLADLEGRLQSALTERRNITKKVEKAGRTHFTDAEESDFIDLSTNIKELRGQIEELREDLQRRDDLHATAERISRGAGSEEQSTAETYGRRWAHDAANKIQRAIGGGESRAVTSGSVDVPVLIPQPVVGLPFKARLIDAFGERRTVESMSWEYFQQTVRTENVGPVEDLGVKPVSTFTMQAVSGYSYYIATLTQPAPIRLLWHFEQVMSWLYQQCYGTLLDGIEQQAISGNGTAPNQTGVLYQSGVGVQHFTTDVPTTIRSAITKQQNLGEVVTGIALNPVDAQNLDLLRWTSANGGFLTGGYAPENSQQTFGSSDNIFGPDARRIVSPNVPQGVALLGDWTTLALYYRDSMRIDIATTGLAADGTDLFTQNAFQIRAEVPVGVAIERPQALCIAYLDTGS